MKDFGVSIQEFQSHLDQNPDLYMSALNTSIYASAMNKLPAMLCEVTHVQQEVCSTVEAASEETKQSFLALDSSLLTGATQERSASGKASPLPNLRETSERIQHSCLEELAEMFGVR